MRNRDKKGRFVKGCVPPGEPFRTQDERATEAGKASGAARREKGDLRKLLKLWMETEVEIDKNGEPVTGAQLMLRSAVKEMKKGNPRFWELLRDTAGFKPADRVIVADVDPEVIAEVEAEVLACNEMDDDDDQTFDVHDAKR